MAVEGGGGGGMGNFYKGFLFAVSSPKNNYHIQLAHK